MAAAAQWPESQWHPEMELGVDDDFVSSFKSHRPSTDGYYFANSNGLESDFDARFVSESVRLKKT